MNRRSFFTRLAGFAGVLFGARQAKGLRRPDLYYGRNSQHLSAISGPSGVEYFRVAPISFNNKPLTREMGERMLQQFRDVQRRRGRA